MSYYWKFSEINHPEEISFNKVLEDFYTSGVSGLVKENIQNALDAKLSGSHKPVGVRIKTGSLKMKAIPGIDEVLGRIAGLKSGNEYTEETIQHMRKSVKNKECAYISFEDMNTKGLSGARKGQTSDPSCSYSAYAYSKGMHVVESNTKAEKSRGGSYGIGKIASNAASDLYMMFFANCDEQGDKHLGGTVQMIDHEYDGKYYRSTGYFTDEVEGKYFPYKNEFHEVFQKDSRGLKIIIPFFRKQFNEEKEIIKSICDNFLIAILDGRLSLMFNNIKINRETISDIVKDPKYYEQEISNMKKNFTPLYLDTYLNKNAQEIVIEDRRRNEYKFKLYFNYDEEIQKGRVAVIRTIGMKIEDMGIPGHATKPYNAVLIPDSSEEDAFLKFLENESHTKISQTHIKDKNDRLNAVRFIKNLHKEISEIISKAMREANPPDAVMDTKDLIYTIEKQLKKDLSNSTATVRSSKGNKKKKVIKVKSATNEKRGGKGNENKQTRTRKVKKDVGNDGKATYFTIDPGHVERVIINDKEHLRFDLSKHKEIKQMKECNIVLAVVDGMGKEYFNEFKTVDNYRKVVDGRTNEALELVDNSIKKISMENGVFDIKAELNKQYNRTLKFTYYMEG